ncbi:MAG TPA: hypothetical protein ENN08_03420, partial [Bacteroidales bacterium]|nr:hypothetical protein [Bacteroidales bacterium]
MKIKLFFSISVFIFSSFTACTSFEEKLIQKASNIHQSILTLDSHTDTPLQLGREGFDIGRRNNPHNRGGKLD